MNITTPILHGAARLADLRGDAVSPLLKLVGDGTGLFDDGSDGGLGMVMSALAGVAAALAVAIVLTVYFRSGSRRCETRPRRGRRARAGRFRRI
jgi:hypothetical protein